MTRLLSLLAAGIALGALMVGTGTIGTGMIGTGMIGTGMIGTGTLPAPIASAWAQGACDPGDKPDNTTATDARRKLEAAGYRQARDLKKGCDNVWHGKAIRDGKTVNVALTPRGEVFIETE